MPTLVNPHKKFQWGLALYGLVEIRAQKCTTPEFDLDQVEHGEGNYKAKTAGMMNFSNFTVERLDSASFPDGIFWQWIQTIQNVQTGIGLPPQTYKRNAQIFKYNQSGIIIGTWINEGVWPKKINGVELDRVSSDNTVETIEFSVDKSFYAG